MTAFQPLARLHAQLVSIDSILKLAGAHAWTPAQIREHKAKELAAAPPPSFWWRHRNKIQTLYTLAMNTCAIPVLASLATLLGVCIFNFNWMQFGLGVAATLLSVGYAGWLDSLNNDLTFRGPAEWVPYSPGSYEKKYGRLPPEAARIVDTVAVFAPNHWCRIQVLENNKFILDPVLEIVRPDGGFRSVYAWDLNQKAVLPH